MSEEKPKYKLIYFPIKALGEPIRFLFNYGGLEFEDVRLSTENWKMEKPSAPFGQVPILEIDGKRTHQSVAICRYLGSVLNLAGNDALENLDIDAVADTVTEFKNSISVYNREDNESPNKDKLKEKLVNETLPFYLQRFDEIAAAGFLALGRLTWVDFYFVGLLDYCNGVMKFDVIDGYSNLMNLRKSIYETSPIKEWMVKRPASIY